MHIWKAAGRCLQEGSAWLCIHVGRQACACMKGEGVDGEAVYGQRTGVVLHAKILFLLKRSVVSLLLKNLKRNRVLNVTDDTAYASQICTFCRLGLDTIHLYINALLVPPGMMYVGSIFVS